MKFKNISLIHKLGWILGLNTVVLLGALAWATHSVHRVSLDVQGLSANQMPRLNALHEIIDGFAVTVVDATHKVRDSALDPAAAAQSVDAMRTQINAKWAATVAGVSGPQEQAVIEKMKPLLARADAAAATASALMRANDKPGLTRFAARDLYPAIDPVTETLAEHILVIRARSKQLGEDAARQAEVTFWTSAASLLGAVVVALGLLSWLRRSVTRPLEAVVRAAEGIAEERTVVLPAAEGGDEVASLVRAMGRLQTTAAISRNDLRGQLSAIDKAQAVISFDLTGKVLSANDNFLRTVGYTLAEVQGQHHSLFVDPAFRASAEYRLFWDKLGRGEYDAGQYKRIAKGGREVWLEASYNPIFDTDGKPFKVVKYATDISTAKLQAADSAGQLAAIHKAQAVIEFTLDGKVVSANDNFLTAMGYTANEIKGQHHSMFVDPALRAGAEYRMFWEKLGRGEYDAGQYKRIAKGGREVWLEASYNPIFDANCKPFKVVKYATDITAAKLQAADSAGQLAAIHKAQAVIEFALDGKVLTANDNFLTTLGYTLSEIKGQHHSLFVDPAFRATAEYRMFWEKLARGEYDAAQYKRIAKGGREVWIEASYNPIFNADGKPFKVVKYATDITAQVHASNMLKEAVQESLMVIGAAKDGNLGERVEMAGKTGPMEQMCSGLNSLMDTTTVIFEDLGRVLGGLASGDLTQRIDRAYDGVFEELKGNANETVEKLSGLIGEVQQAANALTAAASQVSSTANALSQGASEQAASVEQTSASMDDMSSSITQNTENAKVTDGMAAKAATEAQEGGDAVNRTVDAMKQIGGKIGVINDIAYQTNLLALNAAIEAARAGEHGKGFAVVAAEVRKLAEDSQQAAKEIGTLAHSSIAVAEQAGRLLSAMVPSIHKTSELVQEIAASSNEQANGATQINSAMNQLNQTTQMNAAASEELAATATELTSNADQLQDLISFFRLEGAPKSERAEKAGKAEKALKAGTARGTSAPASGKGALAASPRTAGKAAAAKRHGAALATAAEADESLYTRY